MSGKRDLNFSLYSGRLTHPPEMMQYNTGHGHMLCFSLAIHSDAPSDKIDNPMFLDVKVTGASPELHQHHVKHPSDLEFLSRPKDKTTT